MSEDPRGAPQVAVRDLLANLACIASIFVSVVSCVGLFDLHDDCFVIVLVFGLVLQGLILFLVVALPTILLRPPIRSAAAAAYLRKLYGSTVAGLAVEIGHVILRHYTAQHHGGHCM